MLFIIRVHIQKKEDIWKRTNAKKQEEEEQS